MGTPGAMEIILILLVVILLFGAKKLPELARGTGRALRIFKSETKGLIDENKSDDDPDETDTDAHGRPLPSGTEVQHPTYRAEPVEPTSDPAARPTHDQR